MILVEAPSPAVPRTRRLYMHPALHLLADALDQQRGVTHDRVEVTSNAVACTRLLADRSALALTNRTAGTRYGTTELAVLRESWLMPTAVFRRKEESPHARVNQPKRVPRLPALSFARALADARR